MATKRIRLDDEPYVKLSADALRDLLLLGREVARYRTNEIRRYAVIEGRLKPYTDELEGQMVPTVTIEHIGNDIEVLEHGVEITSKGEILR